MPKAASSPVIVISGPPGAGKSTVARLLVEASEGPTAYIEGDTFWQFIAKGAGKRKRKPDLGDARIVVQAMIASALRYARGGYETYLDFSIGPWMVEAITAKMGETPLDYVLLYPSEAACAGRAAQRAEGTIPDYAPYREVHAAFGEMGRFVEHSFRGDNLTPEQLAGQIRNGLLAGDFRVRVQT